MRVKMSKSPPPAPTASAIGPCPTVITIVGRPGTGSLPSTIAPPDHPPPPPKRRSLVKKKVRKHKIKTKGLLPSKRSRKPLKKRKHITRQKKIGWFAGCFGFNGPLRQYFSLYRAVSQREE